MKYSCRAFSMSNIINNGTYKSDTIFFESDSNAKKNIAEEMPLFINCEDYKEKNPCSQKKMLHYIYGKVKYPADARQYGIEGTAVVNFTIDKEGNIKDVKVLRGLCQSISLEVKNLVLEMPKWYKAGTQNGESVSFNQKRA